MGRGSILRNNHFPHPVLAKGHLFNIFDECSYIKITSLQIFVSPEVTTWLMEMLRPPYPTNYERSAGYLNTFTRNPILHIQVLHSNPFPTHTSLLFCTSVLLIPSRTATNTAKDYSNITPHKEHGGGGKAEKSSPILNVV